MVKQMGNERILCIGALLLCLMLPLITSWKMEATSVLKAIPYVTPKYNRIEEAERACEGVIDSASELGPNGISSSDLSFSNGDWNQATSATRPLLPFIDEDGFNGSAPPMKLSTFSLTDYNYANRTKSTVRVNAVLNLVVTRYGPLPGYGHHRTNEVSSQFGMRKGHTRVSVFFQGVYTESEENGGERVMCLLGSAMLPSRQSDSADPWGAVKPSDSMNYDPPLLQDDQILLVLHYPVRFTLTKRKIQGEMRSLGSETGFKYFDKVQILSQLTTQQYKFGSEPQAVHKACDPSVGSLALINQVSECSLP